MNVNKKVLVTGAGGYIGRHVVDALILKGFYVIAADIRTEKVNPKAEYIKADIFADESSIFEKLRSPDICIHLAWKDGFIHNSVSHLENLPFHYRFIRNMVEGGLKHLMVLGTMHEIGYWEGAVDENTPTEPLSFYGISKNSLRQATTLLALERSIILQWLRAFYIVGDDTRNNSIFTKITIMEKEGRRSFPFTTGLNMYDFITVEELANQISYIACQTEIKGIINCCTGLPIKLRDKVEEFITNNFYKIRPEYGAFPDRPYDSPGIWGNPEKIRRIMSLL